MARRKVAADQFDGASAADAPRSQRRKRRASTPLTDDVERAERESTQQSDATSPLGQSQPASETEQPRRSKKRVKRVSITDSEQLNQELQAAVAHENLSSDNIVVAPEQPQHRNKRVRFSDPGPAILNVASSPAHDPSSNFPAVVVTPQGRRGSGQGKSRANRRISLPATLHGSPGSPEGGLIQFTPLRAVLEDRKRRRLRRLGLSEEMNHIEEHKREDARARLELQRLRQQIREKDARVNELMYELEVQRQLAIDIQHDDNEQEAERIKALEDELNNLRSEIAEQKERHNLTSFDDDQIGDYDMDMETNIPEDDGLMLIEPEDINLTHDDMPQFYHDDEDMLSTIDEVAEEGTQVSLPDPSTEVQIQQFENAIAELTKDASEARAALQILTIELQTLGFTEPDSNAYDVLTSIRSAFRHARNEIEAIQPGDSSTTLENGELLYAIIERLRELKSEIEEKTKEIRDQADMNAMLNTQNKGIVSKMAEFENRRKTLEGQWHELDVESEQKTKAIIELEEELNLYRQMLEERDADIIEQDAKMDEMEAELEERDQSSDRLQNAIKDYRDEVASLEALVNRMEEDHRSALAQLKEEYEAAIAELEQKLANEQLQREAAEAETEQKTSFISQLELKVEAAEQDLEQLRADLSALEELKDNEHAQREAAEQELDDKTASIAELEQKVEAAEDDLEQLRSELDALRTLADSERTQREAAEAELDEKDNRITELEDKIHEAGTQANELRQKIFEVQQKKEADIKELQETAAQREEQYNNDIAAEIARREDAEQLATDRNNELNDLQTKLQEVEESLEGLTVEKDDLISELEERVDKLDADLSQLREEYETLAEQKANEIQSLHDDISILNNDVVERAATIEKLRQEALESSQAHQAALEEHESRIADLSADLDHARADISRLEETRKSLESRVEDEAAAMLDLQNQHANEVSGLRDSITDREAQIDDLRHAVEVRDAKYTSDINAKNKEIEALQVVADTRASTIAALAAQIGDLKARFRAQVDRSQKAIAAITENVRRAAEEVGAFEDGHTTEAQDALRDVDLMVPGEGLHAGPSRIHEHVQVFKNDGRRGRRQYDSGFGVAEDEEDEAMLP